jgi:hypothetical protein
MVLGMLGEEGADVEAAADAAVVVVLTAEGIGVRVVRAVVAAALSELDAAAPELLSVAVA